MCLMIKKIIIIIYFLSDFSYGQTKRTWKDYSYLDATQSFYKLHTNNVAWSTANRTCAEDDATLFYPESTYEMNVVKQWWQGCSSGPCVNNTFLHVGYTDKEKSGDFKTIDGIPVDELYNKWSPGEPNNRARDNGMPEHCAELDTEALQLNDIKCDSTEPRTMHPFICKKKLTAISGSNSQSWKDYTYIDFSQSFYKLYIQKKSWLEANSTCISDGAKLFYPESRHEVNLVKEWWEKCKLGPQCLYNDYVHMGYSDLKVKGHFETIDGIPVEQVFHNWQPYEPNLQPGEDCVELSGQNLNLNDIPCEGDTDRVKHSFICKKKLSTDDWHPESNKINTRFNSGIFLNETDVNQADEITDTVMPKESKTSALSYSYFLLSSPLFVIFK